MRRKQKSDRQQRHDPENAAVLFHVPPPDSPTPPPSDRANIPDSHPSRTDPRAIPISSAVDHIVNRAQSYSKPTLIHLTGPVGAGKTTLARGLAAATHGIILSTDHYLPDYRFVHPACRDEPQEADLPALATHLSLLKRGHPAEIPVWSFQTHRREGVQVLHPAPFIICEGLFALHPAVAIHADLLVYVHAESDTRWSRWEAIELRGERGMGVAAARQHFDTIAEPTFHRYAATYKAAAHVIVNTDGV